MNGAVLNENTQRRSMERERRKTNCWKRGKEILGLILRKCKKGNSTCGSENKLWGERRKVSKGGMPSVSEFVSGSVKRILNSWWWGEKKTGNTAKVKHL